MGKSGPNGALRPSLRPVASIEARPVTRANRSFGAAEVAGEEPERLRRLCHGLLIGDGLSILNFRNTAEFDEFTTQGAGSWRPRTMVMRIFHVPVGQEDLDRL